MENREMWAWTLVISFFIMAVFLLRELFISTGEYLELNKESMELCNLFNELVNTTNGQSQLIEILMDKPAGDIQRISFLRCYILFEDFGK